MTALLTSVGRVGVARPAEHHLVDDVEDGPDPDVCAGCDHQRAFHHPRHGGICIGGCDAGCTEFEEPTP